MKAALLCRLFAIELRIMAHLSEDKNMIDAFLSNHDIHAATAAKVYKIDLKDVGSGITP